MRAVILQHNIYEGPGYILSWLHAQGFTTDIFFLYRVDTPPPNILSANLLIILNGSISVYDEDMHPWVKNEKKIIKQAIENNIPTLGICFGAQLIASIYGAKIFASSQQKIGWFSIKTKPKKSIKHFLFPDNLKILLWHKDEFEMPKNAIHLASSSICTNQAFQINNNVIGVQFHPHMTPYLLQYMINNNSLDIKANNPNVQQPQQLFSTSASFFEQSNQLINDIISYLLTTNKKLYVNY